MVVAATDVWPDCVWNAASGWTVTLCRRLLPPVADVTKTTTPAFNEAMSDAAIVARAQQGDGAAFEELVTIHYAACLRFARGVLNDPSEAEDAVQNAFFRVYQALPRFEADGQFKAWLFQIVVNECRMANRSLVRRWRRIVFSDADRLAEHAGVAPPVLEVSLDIGAALGRLDPRQREILLLRFGEDMNYADLARAVGIGESAAKMRVKRACDALRKLLDEGKPRDD